jgi:hypothetical protein
MSDDHGVDQESPELPPARELAGVGDVLNAAGRTASTMPDEGVFAILLAAAVTSTVFLLLKPFGRLTSKLFHHDRRP